MRQFIRLTGYVAVCLGVVWVGGPGGVAQEPTGLITLAATTPRELREADAFVDRLARAGDLQLTQFYRDFHLPGRTHQRMAQYHRGVPVFGADITRQFGAGLSQSVFGTVYRGIDIDSTPTQSVRQAQTAIEAIAGRSLNPNATPQLTVLPIDDEFVLTYQARVFTGNDLRRVFIDAHTGDLVLEFSDLLTFQDRDFDPDDDIPEENVGSGLGVLGDMKKISVQPGAGGFLAEDLLRPSELDTYDLQADVDAVRRLLAGQTAFSPSLLASDSDRAWDDPVVVDGHAHTAWTFDYFFRHLGRSGLDGRGSPIRSIVHPVNRDQVLSATQEDIDLFFLNSFFCPECGDGGVLVYGEGLPDHLAVAGSNVKFWAAALDVVAHELTHGVTAFTSRLGTRDTPGALNEAFSDIIGTAVEFFFQSEGTGPLRADYLIAEDIVNPLAGRPQPIAGRPGTVW